jgi:hypothetical protein
MLDRAVLRVGAAAAMVGAVLAIVFNILHPRSSDVGSAAEEVRLATEEGIWLFDHYMLAWGIGLLLVAAFAVSRSFAREPAVSWGRLALVFAIGSVAIAFATIVIDGWALKEAGDTAEAVTAEAVAFISGGLFLATIGLLFGFTPVLFGIAMLTGDDYPRWLGWTAVVAGVLGIISGTIIYFAGFTEFATNVLFPIASILFTLWIGVSGYFLWQKTSQPTTAVTAPTP